MKETGLRKRKCSLQRWYKLLMRVLIVKLLAIGTRQISFLYEFD
jgi:hypothetical protein